jgi:hypothetical protein
VLGTNDLLRRTNAAERVARISRPLSFERNHQGLGNRLIELSEEVGKPSGEIQCRERLGGFCSTPTAKPPDFFYDSTCD